MRLYNSKPKNTKDDVAKLFGNRVYFGPFSGLKIPQKLVKVLTLTEIIGLYESCLHNVFSDLLNRDIKNVMIVGGNNGYYAAGLSYIFNPKKLWVYETAVHLHQNISLWFENNNLSTIQLLGEANQKEFNAINDNVDLLLMDCEGFEKVLLNPEEFQWQKKSDIIVELHPFYEENLVQLFTANFSQTHTIQLIYDDFNEDYKVTTILKGLNLTIEYDKHPNHRWISEEGNKVYTSGLFLYLKRKI